MRYIIWYLSKTPSSLLLHDSKVDSDGYCHSRGSNFMFKNSLGKLGGGIIMVLILYIAER